MIEFKNYKKFTIGELNIVDPDNLPKDLNLIVFGDFNVLRRVRDGKIMILLPKPNRRPADWKKAYSGRRFEVSAETYQKLRVNFFTVANTLYFYSSENALKFLENVEELDFDNLTDNYKDYEFLDPKRKIIISR